MNRKNTLIVIFVVIGALVVSAFSLVVLNNGNKASLQRGRAADAARYTAMAEYDAAKDSATLQRGREVDAARYTAMARYYEAQNSQPADLTGYYYSERNSYSAAASGTNQPGLELYYQSERNSAPDSAFHYGPPGR